MFLTMMLITSIIIILATVVMILTSILSKKCFMDREKSSRFECGFDP